MKLSKALLQALALAVAANTVVACTKDGSVNPQGENPSGQPKTQVPYDCPACGMG
jgi:hypothetical protein